MMELCLGIWQCYFKALIQVILALGNVTAIVWHIYQELYFRTSKHHVLAPVCNKLARLVKALALGNLYLAHGYCFT
jgi:hypothetical protein